MSKIGKKKRVMVFGTFDGLHRGHLNFFKQARRLGSAPYLIVSIARDINVIKIKGKKPEFNERQRKLLVEKCELVDKVVLSGKNNYITHILKEFPDIIGLGYDQKTYTKSLKNDLKNKNLQVEIIRLKPYKPKIFKNHLIKKII